MGVWSKKESMQMQALQHTQEMQNKYSKEIVSSAIQSIHYKEPLDFELIHTTVKPFVGIADLDTVSAALAEWNGTDAHICILNFASYKNPGGKFLEGSSAQEECLCHESNLYNILEMRDKDYYLPHRGKGQSNNALYYNEALYTPNVIFEKNGIKFECDVLTCAAPNYAAARRYFGVTARENAEVLRSRIEFIWKIMELNNVQTAILGAFGCGVFGQDPNLVAQYMNDIFKQSSISTIVYAVPRGLNERNYQAFERRIEQTDLTVAVN